MNRYDLALIGFGGVNRALAELIVERGPALAAELGFELRVVAITDLRLGSLMQADGIDLSAVLSLAAGRRPSPASTGGDAEPRNEYVIRNTTADIVVEATFTNPVDGEPAISHVRWALESGKHVTTTNKGPVALAGAELARARRRARRAIRARGRGPERHADPPRSPSGCSRACASTASRAS